MKKALFIALQYLLPQHCLSRLLGYLAETKYPAIKNFLIGKFIDHFNVDMSEADIEDYTRYPSFNDFFIRKLKPGARPLETTPETLACPADGEVSQAGHIQEGRIFQAKGHEFSCREILGGNEVLAEDFSKGLFTTIYLSPRDYHRVHMPLDGTLRSVTHIPGRLFSVNQTTTEAVPRLFARNERAVFLFDTQIGPVAIIMVGAMIVASIETAWAGLLAPRCKAVTQTNYANSRLEFFKGDELGRFRLGSTVVMLFPENSIVWAKDFAAGKSVRLGEKIGAKNI